MGARKRSARKIEQPAEPDSRREGRLALAAIALVIVVTLAIYLQIRGHGFLTLDDDEYLTGNPMVQQGLSLHTISWAFTAGYSANWHPLTWLSHILDWQLYGPKPGGQHVTSLLIHLANVLLLFAVLRRMTGAAWKSLFVAALFAVHPLHVESVAWLSERKDVLSTFFWLLTMWAYVAYVRNPKASRYVLVAVIYALGLMAKPMLVTLPLILLLVDWWPLGRFGAMRLRTLVMEKLPLLALSAASCGVTFWAQKSAQAMVPLDAISLSYRVGNALVSYAVYLRRMVWPRGLCCYYPYDPNLPGSQVALSAAIVAGLTVFCLLLGRRWRYLPVGWFWYVVTLAPVIGIVQVGAQSSADRYTYVPLIGIFIIIAWGVPDLAARLTPGSTRRSSNALAGAAVVIVLALSAVTYFQASYWKDSVTLLERAVALTKDNMHAQVCLGNAYGARGDFERAGIHFAEALRIKPDSAEVHYNLANVLAAQGNLPEAVRHYMRALELKPGKAKAHINLAVALNRMGRFDEAIDHFRTAVKLDTSDPDAHYNLGRALIGRGRLDQAASELDKAVAIEPDMADAYGNLAVISAWKRDYAGAWANVRLCRRYGGSLPPQFIEELSKKMPEPLE